MPRYFTAKITSGNAIGPFNIYYDSVNSSNVTTIVVTQSPAINIQRSELTRYQGVQVSMPNSATSVIVYSTSCGTSYSYPLPSASPAPSVTPSISVSKTPSITPSVTSTPNKSPSPTVTPTMTVTPTPSRTTGFVFCLGYDQSLCTGACQDYNLNCLPPSPTPTATPTVTPTPSSAAPRCLGYHETSCAIACSNYNINCGAGVSPSPTPTKTPSVTPSSSPVTLHKATIRLKIEEEVIAPADVAPIFGGTTVDGVPLYNYAIYLFYNITRSGTTPTLAGPWYHLPVLGNSYLQQSGNTEYFFDAFNPTYNSAMIKSYNNTAYNCLAGLWGNTSCEYVASINNIPRGSTLRVLGIASQQAGPTPLYSRFEGSATTFIGLVKHCSNLDSSCPSGFACSSTTNKREITQAGVNSDISVSLFIPTRWKLNGLVKEYRMYINADSDWPTGINPDNPVSNCV